MQGTDKGKSKTETIMPRKKKTPSQGLGDTIEKVTEATGIKKAVELFTELTGIDCGCEKRKEKLNELFRYKKPECLNKEEYEYLKTFFGTKQNLITNQQQVEVLAIYNRVFQDKKKPTNCSKCFRTVYNELLLIYNEYE